MIGVDLAESSTEEDLLHFVEDFAGVLEKSGLQLMAGRIVAYLLVCEPPHQNSAQLAKALHASRGSISTLTRHLNHTGIIELKRFPRDRSTYFQIHPDTFERMFMAQQQLLHQVTSCMAQGLELLKDQPPERRARLRATHEIYSYLGKEMPLMIKRWKESQAALETKE